MSATKAVQLHNGSKDDVAELMEQFGVAPKDCAAIFTAEQPMQPSAASSERPPYLSSIAVTMLRPSPSNPRKRFAQEALDELAASIREQGVMEPLLVRYRQSAKRSDRDHPYWFEIITGERRWRAAKLAGLESVPALVRQMDDEAVLDAQIVENLQREDMTPLEEAAAYEARLKAAGDAGHKMSVADLAKRVGKSQRSLYDRLELLKLSPFAREALENGKISAGHAAELVRLKPELQDDAVREVSKNELSVYALRNWLKDGKAVRRFTLTSATALPRRLAQRARSLLESSSQGNEHIPKGRIRAPFEYDGQLWCCVGSMHRGSVVSDLEAYRVVPRAEFRGKPTTYNGRALRGGGEAARRDPKGFYHGISVTCAGQKFVLCGPPKTFARDPAETMPSKAQKPAESHVPYRPPAPVGKYRPGGASPADVERALKTSLHEIRFRFGFPPSALSLKRARKRGEWIAVLRISAKSGRR